MLLRFPPQQHPWVCLQPRWRGFRRSTSTSCPAWRLSRQAPSRSSSHWRLGSGGRSTTNWRRASWGVSWWKNRARSRTLISLVSPGARHCTADLPQHASDSKSSKAVCLLTPLLLVQDSLLTSMPSQRMKTAVQDTWEAPGRRAV